MKLQDLRRKAGLESVEKLSMLSGVNVNTIKAYERGLRPIDGASLSTLIAFAEVLGCNIADIIEDEELARRLRIVSLR